EAAAAAKKKRMEKEARAAEAAAAAEMKQKEEDAERAEKLTVERRRNTQLDRYLSALALPRGLDTFRERLEAACNVGRSRLPRAHDAVPLLLHTIHDPNQEIRDCSVESLVQVSSPTDTATIQLLDADGSEVALEARRRISAKP